MYLKSTKWLRRNDMFEKKLRTTDGGLICNSVVAAKWIFKKTDKNAHKVCECLFGLLEK